MIQIRVWDWPTRLFHWTLAALIIALVITGNVGGNAMVWHFRCGYCVLSLLIFRIVWGFCGGHWSRWRHLAFTPAFPYPEAFTDPTHVNFITEETHQYFIGEHPSAAMYGFKGAFDIVQVRRDAPTNAYKLNQPNWRKALRRIHRKIFTSGLPHILWELTAKK